MKFSELVRLLEHEGFRVVKEKGSIRYYAKAGHPHLIRVDFHGSKEMPTRTCHEILHSKLERMMITKRVSFPVGGLLLLLGRKPLRSS